MSLYWVPEVTGRLGDLMKAGPLTLGNNVMSRVCRAWELDSDRRSARMWGACMQGLREGRAGLPPPAARTSGPSCGHSAFRTADCTFLARPRVPCLTLHLAVGSSSKHSEGLSVGCSR